jgi:hypothetical protein
MFFCKLFPSNGYKMISVASGWLGNTQGILPRDQLHSTRVRTESTRLLQFC